MHLRKLGLFNFRNYESADFTFEPGLNCILGNNATGKTNLLDSVYFLALTKSAFSGSDSESVRHHQNGFIIRGRLVDQNNEENIVVCSFDAGKGKFIRYNDEECLRFADHIGKIPVVFVGPDDVDIIRGGSEVRRKFFDSCLSQIDREYLNSLISFKKLIRQRNALLKNSSDRGVYPDQTLLESYDRDLIPLNLTIAKKRSAFLDNFNTHFNENYRKISGGKEEIIIEYESDVLKDNFSTSYIRSKRDDIVAKRTLQGVHRDDFGIYFKKNSKSIKDIGSQGQKKSVTLSLKIAQAEIIKLILNITPILLLDDIFDRMDENRIDRLLSLVSENFEQIILTDARRERTKIFLSENNHRANLISIN